ncbi:Ras-related protein Rab-43 [Tritrichomonas foetus]|uniref:Ras-related protein Rab-43 n=1 Tax=Tritrichomonas foetus TaxID=1144522 RepID=A0A1J4KCU8_9EUKA|nr:Ras-related protein Rab-43 [Tritrichomonas foetus]|eukprot:OHT07470.1 Ras-related protein Rab-43 [Tritrichomonas foetus]
MTSEALKFKAVLIGDSTVGKTALFQRLESDTFEESHIPTVGGSYSRISITSSTQCVFDIGLWDTAGQERFRNVVPMYFQNANIILVVYDITNRESYDNIGSWIELANQKAPANTKLILIGNKSDLDDIRAISLSEMQDTRDHFKFFGAVETSALNGRGVDILLSIIEDACESEIANTKPQGISQPSEIKITNESGGQQNNSNQKKACDC